MSDVPADLPRGPRAGRLLLRRLRTLAPATHPAPPCVSRRLARIVTAA